MDRSSQGGSRLQGAGGGGGGQRGPVSGSEEIRGIPSFWKRRTLLISENQIGTKGERGGATQAACVVFACVVFVDTVVKMFWPGHQYCKVSFLKRIWVAALFRRKSCRPWAQMPTGRPDWGCVAAAPSGGAVGLSLKPAGSPAGLVATWIAEFYPPPQPPAPPQMPRASDSESWGGPRLCISDKLPDDADTAGTGTTQSWSVSAICSQLSRLPSLICLPQTSLAWGSASCPFC